MWGYGLLVVVEVDPVFVLLLLRGAEACACRGDEEEDNDDEDTEESLLRPPQTGAAKPLGAGGVVQYRLFPSDNCELSSVVVVSSSRSEESFVACRLLPFVLV
jgi:hypothetical protein